MRVFPLKSLPERSCPRVTSEPYGPPPFPQPAKAKTFQVNMNNPETKTPPDKYFTVKDFFFSFLLLSLFFIEFLRNQAETFLRYQIAYLKRERGIDHEQRSREQSQQGRLRDRFSERMSWTRRMSEVFHLHCLRMRMTMNPKNFAGSGSGMRIVPGAQDSGGGTVVAGEVASARR